MNRTPSGPSYCWLYSYPLRVKALVQIVPFPTHWIKEGPHALQHVDGSIVGNYNKIFLTLWRSLCITKGDSFSSQSRPPPPRSFISRSSNLASLSPKFRLLLLLLLMSPLLRPLLISRVADGTGGGFGQVGSSNTTSSSSRMDETRWSS